MNLNYIIKIFMELTHNILNVQVFHMIAIIEFILSYEVKLK